MADRLTQLQDCINKQAEHFCNSIGILQQFASPSKFPNFDRSGSQTPQQQQNQEDYVQLFTTLIARCAKDIDTLIESLPSEESSTELQLQSLRILEQENQEAAERLEAVVRNGQELLEKIQAALSDIAQAQLDMQHLTKTIAQIENKEL
ncbi:mediator of RNA polymerase II transcription subunit 21 [Diabrotica virgifera virgifera]|uniref:Mediator of RNA polymerase II transcription subunit 21 n=1 Tax=Diabrotica virgifera virgifera TaxID=50390 RepID=A0A6P7GKN3_DIAVI|nr:mediator of RNA polymerase II transcription subunit 21 [Diabrotica virgifera virgifera]